MELLGLASFLDDALLGSEDAFRATVRRGGRLTDGPAQDLQARLAPVVLRTLRRQVKEYVRFTARREHGGGLRPLRGGAGALRPGLRVPAPRGHRRHPAGRAPSSVLVYRKILASSSFALAATLGAGRLRQRSTRRSAAPRLPARPTRSRAGAGRLRPRRRRSWFDEAAPPRPRPGARPALRGRGASSCAPAPRWRRAIQVNAKGEALVRGLDRCFTVAQACGWPEKAVVFTEFRRTQDYLAKLLAVARLRGHLPLRRRLGHRRSGPGAGGGVPRPDPDPPHDRGRGRGAQPPVLQPGGELRPALEPAAGRAAHRPLPPLRPAARRAGGELPQPRRTPPTPGSTTCSRRSWRLFDGVFGSSDEILGALGSGIDFERRVLDIYQSCRSPRGDRPGLRRAPRATSTAASTARLTRGPHPALRALRRRGARGGSGWPAGGRGGGGPAPEERARLRPAGPRERSARGLEVSEAAGARALDAGGRGALAPARRLRALPARLARLAGGEGWWFVYRFEATGLLPEERLLHLVLLVRPRRLPRASARGCGRSSPGCRRARGSPGRPLRSRWPRPRSRRWPPPGRPS